jgi:UDP-glucose 4-epimerase
MKKILVTGCRGYIGQHLIKMLANYPYEVYGIDNVPTTYRENFANLDIMYDVNQASWLLSDIPTEFDTIIHLAAMVKVNESVQNPLLYYDININGTVNLLQRLEFKSFLFASTGAAESCGSPYAISKRATEDIVAEYCTKMKRNFINYRFYNVVGSDGFPPTNRDGLFFNLIKAETTGVFKVYGDDWNTRDGTCVRDYLHVNEVAKALINGIENPTNKIENLGSGNGTTVKEMIDNYKLANKCKFDIQVLPRRPGDVESTVLTNVSPLMEHMYSLKDLMMKP